MPWQREGSGMFDSRVMETEFLTGRYDDPRWSPATVETTVTARAEIESPESTCVLKRQPPDAIAAGGQHDERVLQRRHEDDSLQPFRPREATGKSSIAITRDYIAGFMPQ